MDLTSLHTSCYGRVILEDAARVGKPNTTDQTLLATCTRYPFLDAEGNAQVFCTFLLKQTTALIKIFKVNYLSLNYMFMTEKC